MTNFVKDEKDAVKNQPAQPKTTEKKEENNQDYPTWDCGASIY